MLARTKEHREFMRPNFPSAFELFYAVITGTVADVRERLDAGDDPNAPSKDGRTPITFAVNAAWDLNKAHLLFAAGARIDVTRSHGGPIIEGVIVRIADVRGTIARLEIAR